MNKTTAGYRLVSTAWLVVVLLSAGCGVSPPRHVPKESAVRLEMADMGICSGTIIGPHAVLTATHCFEDTTLVRLNDTNAEVIQRMDDGRDHTIVLVNRTFVYWVSVGSEAQQGDDVYYWGNPDGIWDWYRRGYVVGTDTDAKGRPLTVYDINGFFGDSGSGIFNAQGQLVAVTSLCDATAVHGLQFKMMASYPLNFTLEQWVKAGA